MIPKSAALTLTAGQAPTVTLAEASEAPEHEHERRKQDDGLEYHGPRRRHVVPIQQVISEHESLSESTQECSKFNGSEQ